MKARDAKHFARVPRGAHAIDSLTPLRLYVLLCGLMNKESVVWQTQQTMAAELGVGVRSVVRSLNHLEAEGWVVKVPAKGRRGFWYQVLGRVFDEACSTKHASGDTCSTKHASPSTEACFPVHRSMSLATPQQELEEQELNQQENTRAQPRPPVRVRIDSTSAPHAPDECMCGLWHAGPCKPSTPA